MTELTHGSWALAIVAATIVGLSKTGIPGLGVFAVAIFANILPAKLSTGALLPLLIVADLLAVSTYRQHAVWSHLWGLMPWVAAGVVAGFFAMDHMNDLQMRRLIGGIVVSMVILHFWRDRQRKKSGDHDADAGRVPHSAWFRAVMGLLAGFTTMVANAAGPIMILYMLAVGLPKFEFLGTGAWFFLLVNVFKLPFSAVQGLVTTDTLVFNLALAPVVIVSAVAGKTIAHRVNQRLFSVTAMILALIAGLRLIL
jgi:uncharacterized membrane protein YfcA